MATKKSVGGLKEADLKGKKVFVRVDLNVPLDDNFNITVTQGSVLLFRPSIICCGILLVLMAVGNFINTIQTFVTKSRFKAKMKRSKSKPDCNLTESWSPSFFYASSFAWIVDFNIFCLVFYVNLLNKLWGAAHKISKEEDKETAITDMATKADVEGKPNKVSNLHRSNDEPV
ncbi:hypothetical protein CXB51_028429 [Gossypium anomalum]|uniref:phosphoglycerate kinase n=1 Tax=Gossypium anomalum TaxID=47600 RepID=A0A8J5YIQ5_9ROSI|nr:hypothetical protein CXB51_028429 [Gossypium anomalum]